MRNGGNLSLLFYDTSIITEMGHSICPIAFMPTMHAFMLYPISIYQSKVSRPVLYIRKPFFNPGVQIIPH
nr:MAG TPA: hypothetical protein [Caudoviricetes sp.]